MSVIRTPLGYVILLLMMVAMAALTLSSAISGELTSAAITGAGFLSIIMLLVAVNTLGKGGK